MPKFSFEPNRHYKFQREKRAEITRLEDAVQPTIKSLKDLETFMKENRNRPLYFDEGQCLVKIERPDSDVYLFCGPPKGESVRQDRRYFFLISVPK